MTATIDANGKIILAGDGTGQQTSVTPLNSAPSGTNQMIAVIRVESPSGTADISSTVVDWPTPFLYGLKFDATQPSSSQLDHADYSNFFGAAMGDTGAPYTEYITESGGISRMMGDFSSNPRGYWYDGNGNSALLTSSNAYYPFTIPVGANYGGVVTIVWRIRSSLTDDSVLYEVWHNDDSIDLGSFDIDNDMDPDDPKAFFPTAGGFSGTLHGDVTGTNWRPTTGAMAFPTHFHAANPTTNITMEISYLGVQYSTLTL